jgi:ribosomal protein L24E
MAERMVCKKCGEPIAPGTGYVRVDGRPAHLVCPAPKKPRRLTEAQRRPKSF